ncbi:MAG: GNAT family N-acetyltransferase [Clostridiaceae bacterium]|nr:GNAT family N-acetyltransferase [Eubacteriales bacterium]
MPDMETGRLWIRGTRESDGPACLDIWMDDEMGRYMADPPRDKADEAELNFAVGIEEEDGWYPMVVFHKATGDFLGTCSVVPMDGGKRWDLGYAVHKKYWRQGYATELLQKLVETGKENGVCSFSARVAKENAASNAVLKKLGFQVWKDTGSFRKRGTDIVFPEYTYLLDIKGR